MRTFLPLFFCFIFFLTDTLPAQALPVRVTSNSRAFSIPFEIRPDLSADPVKEVELMMSDDNGIRWQLIEKRPVNAKRFDFRAEKDGEYWFCFRTVTLSGMVKPTGTGPQLRVLIDTVHQVLIQKSPTAVSNNSSNRSDRTVTPKSALNPEKDSYGMLVPPKPLRVKKENEKVLLKEESKTGETVTEGEMKSENDEKPSIPLLISPDGTIAETVPAKTTAPTLNQSESDKMVLQLLAGMDSFYNGTLKAMQKDVKPVLQHKQPSTSPMSPSPAVPNGAVASNAVGTAAVKKLPEVEKNVPPGTITGISLNRQGQLPQLIVKWNTGGEQWKDSQVDILRCFNVNGQEPYVPIAINLNNTGQYWWFLSPDDQKPFFIRIRLRSASGGILTDTTQMPIQIPTNLLVSPSP